MNGMDVKKVCVKTRQIWELLIIHKYLRKRINTFRKFTQFFKIRSSLDRFFSGSAMYFYKTCPKIFRETYVFLAVTLNLSDGTILSISLRCPFTRYERLHSLSKCAHGLFLKGKNTNYISSLLRLYKIHIYISRVLQNLIT